MSQDKENKRNGKTILHMFIPFMTVDRRQNPDRTLVRGTRISSYRKLQCYKCYKCVKQLIVRVGCGKGQRMVACHSFILWFVQLHITPKAHTLHTHAHKHRVKENEERLGSVSG